MSKKEKTLKSLLIALAPSLFAMGIDAAVLSDDPIQGGLLILCGLLAAGAYELLQSREIAFKLPDTLTQDTIEDALDGATDETADRIRSRWKNDEE